MLISFEGIDGCGKTTQAQLLHERLLRLGLASKFVHYPDYDGEVGQHLIAPFLRGEFGTVESVNPWLVGVIFSVDRITSASVLKDALAKGGYVVTDRYVLSNVAFQGAKVADPKERESLQTWIRSFESSQGVPSPDRTFLLDLPARSAHQRANTSDGRAYLAGATDIHEQDPDLQLRVSDEYRKLAAADGRTIRTISCVDSRSRRKAPYEVFDEVWASLVDDGLIDDRHLRCGSP